MSRQPDDQDKDAEGVNEEGLSEVIQYLQAEDAASRESALESEASFALWLNGHPGLRQMLPVESLAKIGPAIIRFLRAMLGLDKGKDDGDGGAAA